MSNKGDDKKMDVMILELEDEGIVRNHKATENMEESTKQAKKDLSSERIITKDFVIRRDAGGKVIREFEGMNMKVVYESKPLIYKVVKRFFDIVISAIGLIMLSPIFLITAVLIKREDGGPVFFSGQRWGKDFKYFPMHKFRSMCVDAEKMTSKIVTENDKNGMAFKIIDDPRMTEMGRFMRKTSIDELPQLFNVLKGEMSLVGPRPIQTTTTDGDPYDMQRWCVKPGITCIWQVCGRAEVPWDEWVEMDLRYINGMSLWTDFKILVWTVKAVLHKGGAI